MVNNFVKFMESPALFRWQPAAWLRVTGEDSFNFLQGQFTNDLRLLAKDGAVYGLWLNHKGRVLADSFVLRGATGEFWIGSYFCSGTLIRERLEAFIIADDVVVEDVSAEWRGVSLLGDVEADMKIGIDAGGLSFVGRRTVQPHREFVYPASSEEIVSSRIAGMREISATELEQLRILDGIPAVPADIGPGELPNEGALEVVAISYVKGCYLGQEVMARLKTMGQVRRRLLRVEGIGAVPALPAAIYQGDRRLGELRTVATTGDGFIGLALLSLLYLRAENGLSFSAGGDTTLKVSEPT